MELIDGLLVSDIFSSSFHFFSFLFISFHFFYVAILIIERIFSD